MRNTKKIQKILWEWWQEIQRKIKRNCENDNEKYNENSKEIVRMTMRNTKKIQKKLWEWWREIQRKVQGSCENDDEKYKEKSKEIVRMMMVDPHFRFSCDRPPAKSAHSHHSIFCCFRFDWSLMTRRVRKFEKDCDHDGIEMMLLIVWTLWRSERSNRSFAQFPKCLNDNFLTTQKNNSIRGVLFHNDRDDDGLFPGGLKHMLPLHINIEKEK